MSQADFIQDGDAIDWRPASDVVAGQVVLLTKFVTVAKRDIKAGEWGALATKGVYDFDADYPDGGQAGDAAYWDITNSKAVPDSNAGANPQLGVLLEDVAAGATRARILLWPKI